MLVLKTAEDKINESLLETMVEKYVHVPSNPHNISDQFEDGAERTINAWFAGKVAGYEKATVWFDYEAQKFLDEPIIHHNILLADGMGYILSPKAEVRVLTETEFTELVAKFQAEQMVNEEAKKIILPGEGM